MFSCFSCWKRFLISLSILFLNVLVSFSCKVRDHCHYTGEYRGAAHSIWNLKCTVPKTIPTVFHNGSNYDYHFIIKELAEEFKRTTYLFVRKY